MEPREVFFSQEQYDILRHCAMKEDMTEWNECRAHNPEEPILLDGANLEGVNLERANLNRANLERANLEGVNLLTGLI